MMKSPKSTALSLSLKAGIASLPNELILHILSYLDVPELLSLSRTNHQLRQLCLDPLLHTARLARASLTLSRSIPSRPALAELVQHRIYISRTSLAARNLGRDLIKIKLNRSLLQRPSASHLVAVNVLPNEYLHTHLAPSLISTKRKFEKERVKDVLRHWIEEWSRKGSRVAVAGAVENKPDVRILARRFARAEAMDHGFGRGERRELPTRAKVLGLRRFWEGVGKDGLGMARC